MDKTLQDYQQLQKKYKILKTNYKIICKWHKSDGKHIMDLEAEILDINTKTLQEININNNRFINN